jgi:NADH:ubiquinone oxidoreductase subunit 6 (chain J)
MTVLFYLSAALAIVATVMTITRRVAIHALLYLVISLLATAIIFYTLGAPFVAALEVIVYAGAIMVLFLFVIMMLNLTPQAVQAQQAWFSLDAWAGPAILALLLVAELIYALASGLQQPPNLQAIEPKAVALALYGPYLLAVELASVLLLAGLVGAYHLGHRPPVGVEKAGEVE